MVSLYLPLLNKLKHYYGKFAINFSFNIEKLSKGKCQV